MFEADFLDGSSYVLLSESSLDTQFRGQSVGSRLADTDTEEFPFHHIGLVALVLACSYAPSLWLCLAL